MEFLGRAPVPNAPVVEADPWCAWFAGHRDRLAVAHTWHPILGWVPVCAWCVDFVTGGN